MLMFEFASPLCLLLLAALALSAAATPAAPASIRHVRVVYMNHLDVGFDGIGAARSCSTMHTILAMQFKNDLFITSSCFADPELGFAKNVVNRYFDVYFPRALATAQARVRLAEKKVAAKTSNISIITHFQRRQ